MKTVFYFLFDFVFTRGRRPGFLQQARLKSLQGKIAPFSVFAKKDSLFLICFWSVASEESITELNSINSNLENWQKMINFSVYGGFC